MKRLVSIGEAASVLGVSITTLRRWEASGRLAAEHTAGGHRRYDLAKLKPELFRAEADAQRRTVAYARVSSLRGRPPRRPFSRAAAALAALFTRPPCCPSFAAIQC